MKNELISVIIPTYNRGTTIARAIDSVLSQSYKNIELIIVDDCSTDNTKNIVDNYNDKRIRYFRLEKNSGACFARNYGVQKSEGKYVAFQDSDDEWHVDKLKFQYQNLLNNNSDIDFCEYEKFDGERLLIFPNKKDNINIEKYGIEKALRFGNFISTQLLLLKKECFNYYLFDNNLPRLQDYDLILILSSKYKISFTKKILATIYVQNDSISKSSDKLNKAIDIMLNKEYNYEKILYSQLYVLLANNTDDCRKKRHYYYKSLKTRFSFKTLIKLLLNY